MTSFLDLFGSYNFAVRDAMILTLVALSIQVLLRAGLFALPQVGFMAIGAYTGTILTLDVDLPFPVALLAAGVFGGVAGLILAAVLGRLTGIYLAIATIAFSEVVRVAILNLPVTGEAQGRYGIARDANDLYIGITLAVVVLGLGLIAKSGWGLATTAIREDPLMAAHQGVNVYSLRLSLFSLSGAVAGVAGGLYVHMAGFVDPGFFTFGLLVQLLAIVIIGGITSVAGSLLGAVIIFGLPQVLGGFQKYQDLIYGLVVVVVIAFAPDGIGGLLRAPMHRLRLAISGRRGRSLHADLAHEPGQIPVPTSREQAAHQPARAHVVAPEPLVDVSAVAMHFGGVRALQDVSLSAFGGEILGLIGPNGSGKTTLLNVLSGVYSPTHGRGAVVGQRLGQGGWHIHGLARAGVARTFQTIRLMTHETVADNVVLGLHGRSAEGGAEHVLGGLSRQGHRVRRVLQDLDLAPFSDVPAGSLPYGVQRRVEMARALVSDPSLLLLDEPTAGMNPQEREDVFELIVSLRRDTMAIVVVEHDVGAMGKYCDRLAALNFGTVISSGRPDVVLRDEEVVRAYIGGGSARS